MTFPIIPASTINGSYQISRSLRFRNSATSYLQRTPTSAGSRTAWTWSGWVKVGLLSASNTNWLFFAGTNGTNDTGIYFGTDFTLQFYNRATSTINGYILTPAVFRDVSAWYHVVAVYDASNATPTDRMRLYVNGNRQTVTVNTQLGSGTNSILNSTVAHNIGSINTTSSSNNLDGYLAEVNFIDGQALTPSSFGVFDTNGVWQPAKYTGSYTGNSFYLPFTNSSAIGTDSSGLGNNWTPSASINTTSSGVTYDWMLDSPTNYADGGNGRGNYAVWNPLSSAATYADANLSVTTTNTAAPYNAETTIKTPSSGKWYAEITLSAKGAGNPVIGIGNNNPDRYAGYRTNGTYVSSVGSSTGTPATFTTNDVIGVAFDADNGNLNFYKNGSLQTGGFTGITAGNYSFILREDSTSGDGAILNCGQRPFTYSNYGTDRPAATFLALNTQNLPTPTIAAGNKYFDATTYSGGGSTATNVAVNFQPDFTWFKRRSGTAQSHRLFDALRGNSTILISDSTNADSTGWTGDYTSTSTGFTVATGTGLGLNASSETFVAWNWNAGGAPTTDNVAGAGNVPTAGSVKINGANSSATLAGSIAATRLSANTSAGFSVVTFTGNGTNGSAVGHGLGVAPSMIILKKRSAAQDWYVGATAIGWDKCLSLNSTAAQTTGGQWFGNGTGVVPTSTVFYLGGAGNFVNDSGSTYVVYCFAPVAGYSAAFSYAGNGATGTAGSADGPFVYLNFRPRFILIKRYDTGSTDPWVMIDTSRDTYNVANNGLLANTSGAESTGWYLDVLSNGFKIRTLGSASSMNASGGTYLGFAWAENPFRTARAR